MALRTYGPQTLNDNWFEERAPPLRGVVADYGEKCFDTTNKGTFQGLQENKGVGRAETMRRIYAKGANGLAMAQLDTYEQVTRERISSVPEKGFGSLLPSHAGHDEERHLTTVSSVAYPREGAGRDNISTQKKLLKEPTAPFAEGRGGARIEKGIATSGVIGEVFKQGLDPQRNTACQRSWMYQEDPMLHYKLNGLPPNKPHENTSITMVAQRSERYNPFEKNQRHASITKQSATVGVPNPGRNIYLDE